MNKDFMNVKSIYTISYLFHLPFSMPQYASAQMISKGHSDLKDIFIPSHPPNAVALVRMQSWPCPLGVSVLRNYCNHGSKTRGGSVGTEPLVFDAVHCFGHFEYFTKIRSKFSYEIGTRCLVSGQEYIQYTKFKSYKRICSQKSLCWVE